MVVTVALLATVHMQAVVFKDMESLLKMSAPQPLGTLAFVLDEEVLLVRVSNGWQYVAVNLALSTTLCRSSPLVRTFALCAMHCSNMHCSNRSKNCNFRLFTARNAHSDARAGDFGERLTR